MENKLAKIYYSPGGYWKGITAIKKLAEAAKAPEETAKKWLVWAALWQIFLPAPRHIPRPKFDVSTPNRVHQADLLFLPHDKLPRGRKVFKYALTVVDVASRYKEAEPITSKNSDEVAKLLKQSTGAALRPGLKCCRSTPGANSWVLSQKRKKITQHISGAGVLTSTATNPLSNVSTARWLSTCSGTSMPWKCYSLRASVQQPGLKDFLMLFRL